MDMKVIRLAPTLIELRLGGEPIARAEAGPLLVEVDKATPELLSDENTAPYYHRGGFDKFGRLIVIDEYEGDVYGPNRVDGFGNELPNSGPLLQRGSGAKVKDGQPFAYLDRYADPVWHIYEFCTEEWTGPNTLVVDEAGEPVLDADGKLTVVLGPAWRRRGWRATEGEAVAVAANIVATRAGS